ncbi:MAG: DUF4097 family beta strand repeat-containing protein [Gemmatimonadetes bacterium]|nr:DUF4097 family beta strand repeat-containing protein [Gemmatimonadota bacterium]
MSTERLEILKMLSEGKINPEEAELLLCALDEPSGPEGHTETEDARREKSNRPFDRFTEVFSELGKEIESEVGKAMDSVRWQDIGKMVNEAVDQATSSVADTSNAWERGAGRRRAGKQQEWTFDAAGIATIDARTVNGSISVKSIDGDRIVVRAWKAVHGQHDVREAFDREVEVRTEQVSDVLRVFADHPRPPGGVSLAVHYEIETPRAMSVRLRTVNGKISVQGIDGAMDAESVNGVVALEGDTGPFKAQTVNGKIRAEIGRLLNAATFLTTNGAIDLDVDQCAASTTARTNNGAVRMTLGSDFSGNIDAKTNNGRVRCDFPIAAERQSRKRLKGVIGSGSDVVVKLRSMNGSIHLKHGERTQ